MTNRFNVNETREVLSRHDLLGTKGDSLNKNAYMYNLVYCNHYDYLINIVTNLFTWKNLPTSKNGQKMRSSFFEKLLIYGCACVSELPEFGVMITPCVIEGTLNYWGNPTKVRLCPPPYATDLPVINRTLDISNDYFVFVRNDNFCVGFYPLLLQVTENLTTIYMTMLANISGQKFPFVMRGNKDSKLEMEIITNKIDSYEQYIMVKDKGNFENSANLGAIVNKEMPYVVDKLYQSYTDVLNNFFMRIGINMIPNTKKERMLVDEVNANNQAVETSGDIYLNCREEGCREMNEMFGLSVVVERNYELMDSLITGKKPIDDITHDYMKNMGGGDVSE